ncbi:MAG TPA: hypothetical protein PKA06_05800, partial [Gemmatales bacterium]|nr:hypothetical protein [Gemmatales bacterium]
SLNPLVKSSTPQDNVTDPLAPPKKTQGPQVAKPEECTRLVIARYQNDPARAETLEFNRITEGKSTKWVMVAPV